VEWGIIGVDPGVPTPDARRSDDADVDAGNVQMSATFRDAIRDGILIALYDYWRARKLGAKLPGRADIDPVDMPRAALPYIVLMEIGDGGKQIRYRLVGTAIVDEWGADVTGKYLDEVMEGTYLQFVRGLYMDVIAHRCAVLSESTFRWDVGKTVWAHRLYMPLASDGETVDMVLIGQTFSRSGDRRDEPWKLVEATHGHTELNRIHDTA
jgi:hypothetical protein